MFKHLSILAAAVLAVSGLLASKPSEAQTGPAGPGWYFVSVCGLTEPAASQYCWFGYVGYFGPYTTESSCSSALQSLLNYNSVLVTWPYAPSSCFYMN